MSRFLISLSLLFFVTVAVDAQRVVKPKLPVSYSFHCSDSTLSVEKLLTRSFDASLDIVDESIFELKLSIDSFQLSSEYDSIKTECFMDVALLDVEGAVVQSWADTLYGQGIDTMTTINMMFLSTTYAKGFLPVSIDSLVNTAIQEVAMDCDTAILKTKKLSKKAALVFSSAFAKFDVCESKWLDFRNEMVVRQQDALCENELQLIEQVIENGDASKFPELITRLSKFSPSSPCVEEAIELAYLIDGERYSLGYYDRTRLNNLLVMLEKGSVEDWLQKEY